MNQDMQKARRELNTSGTRLAIAHVDNDPYDGVNAGRHWILIYKDDKEEWRNWDHSSLDENWQDRPVNWNLVEHLIYGK